MQKMLTLRGHLLVTWLKLPSSRLSGRFWILGGEGGGGVNIYNILDFWKIDKEMVLETNIMNEVNLHTAHLVSFIQY